MISEFTLTSVFQVEHGGGRISHYYPGIESLGEVAAAVSAARCTDIGGSAPGQVRHGAVQPKISEIN